MRRDVLAERRQLRIPASLDARHALLRDPHGFGDLGLGQARLVAPPRQPKPFVDRAQLLLYRGPAEGVGHDRIGAFAKRPRLGHGNKPF